MTINHCNLITETIVLIFATFQDNVSNPRCFTTENNDNVFSGWRGERREATAKECAEIETKRCNIIRSIFSSNLKASREPMNGYRTHVDAFVKAT